MLEAEALSLTFAPAAEREALSAAYASLLQRIAAWQLLQPPVWELQPLLRGAELAELFGASGPRVGALVSLALDFQIGEEAPRRNDRNACLEWLRTQKV